VASDSQEVNKRVLDDGQSRTYYCGTDYWRQLRMCQPITTPKSSKLFWAQHPLSMLLEAIAHRDASS
jgi:hypothetical protein